MPRTSFDRRTNAELVARGVNELGPLATVNERNDIVVDGFKVSGSAYKIVNKRAYHHGTMLIDAKLHLLGDLLRNDKDTLHTKGVDSVRSPVRNLREWSERSTHEAFVNSVSEEFTRVYGGDGQISEVDETYLDGSDTIQKGINELKSWEWSHGQTPEFTHDLTKTFSWGEVSVHIKSKHGIINACQMDSPSSTASSQTSVVLRALGNEVVGMKYGILNSERDDDGEIRQDVLDWLRQAM